MASISSSFRKMAFCPDSLRSCARILLISALLPLVVMMSASTGSPLEAHPDDPRAVAAEEAHAIELSEFQGPTTVGDVMRTFRVGGRDGLYPRPRSLAQVYDRLAADADRGDRLAACLLSRALALCDKESDQEASLDPLIDSAAMAEPGSDDESRFVEFIAKTWPSPVERSAMCRGLPAARLREKDARMLQAARLGDPLAMTHFALHSRTSDIDDNAKKDFDEEYRSNAVSMIERSASMGDIAALRELFMMYLYGLSPNRSGIAVVDADPAAALAISAALSDVIDQKQEAYIASLLEKEGVSIETVDMSRYAALREQYRVYAKATYIAGFEGRAENTEIEACWTLR